MSMLGDWVSQDKLIKVLDHFFGHISIVHGSSFAVRRPFFFLSSLDRNHMFYNVANSIPTGKVEKRQVLLEP